MTITGVVAIISALSRLVGSGIQAKGIVEAGLQLLGIMQKENRDPTDVEIDFVVDRIKARSERIQNA